jgi:hypothetical protein
MSSPVFNVKYYLRSNPDLVKAFGTHGFQAAVQHWIQHNGVDETRRSAYIFDVISSSNSSRMCCAPPLRSRLRAAGQSHLRLVHHSSRLQCVIRPLSLHHPDGHAVYFRVNQAPKLRSSLLVTSPHCPKQSRYIARFAHRRISRRG